MYLNKESMLPFPAKWAAMAALQGMISVAAGAFGAHALTKILDQNALSWWHTGSQYLMYHALAGLLAAALSSYITSSKKIIVLFSVGNIFFAGSLYIMALTGVRWLGAITPIGGVCYLFAWLFLVKSLWQWQSKE
ncbi:DUF423 domain-containing protein [Marinomonas pollencensis]|uniref:Uncharacterized membrane protein YgdD (TMEM256/DUF423 family) n=1 Tax=Marinomonas pollencensis TaxID=491954 RepID=A0A3E0DJ14_9GAMM|nr:DUF423 domain-containing protein [Marinomonas pollencensis]REG82694.1 uncharacterized membrane protein YgdD (TMEM256/DUF423 family) [Marinomonas pollencensis]